MFGLSSTQHLTKKRKEEQHLYVIKNIAIWVLCVVIEFKEK